MKSNIFSNNNKHPRLHVLACLMVFCLTCSVARGSFLVTPGITTGNPIRVFTNTNKALIFNDNGHLGIVAYNIAPTAPSVDILATPSLVLSVCMINDSHGFIVHVDGVFMLQKFSYSGSVSLLTNPTPI